MKLQFPNAEEYSFGDSSHDPVILKVNDYKFLNRCAMYGEIGFGESFMYNEWQTDQLSDVLMFFLDNESHLFKHSSDTGMSLFHKFNVNRHHAKKNSKTNAKRNIASHYDLSNTFYQYFLDTKMHYSSAIYLSDSDSLEQAQENKSKRLIEQLHVSKEDHVLEIGSGWGAMSLEVAKQTGAKVTTLTLSQAQHDFLKQKIIDEGLRDRVDVKLQDYRDEQGVYDAILSVEMIEAVGHQFLPTFFNQCAKNLKDGGRFVLQSITIDNDRYAAYLKSTDWIQKHIFPGGHLPCLDILNQCSSIVTLLKEMPFL